MQLTVQVSCRLIFLLLSRFSKEK